LVELLACANADGDFAEYEKSFGTHWDI